VAERVVHELEAVEVDEQHREFGWRWQRGEREREALVHEAAVRQAGERVVIGEEADLSPRRAGDR
jgi:hypothetical protein